MRLFLALDLPDDARHAIHAAAWPGEDLARAWRGVAVENLHVTLAFLGDVEADRVPALVAAISAVPREGTIELVPTQAGCFPPRGPARVLVAHLGGAGVERLARLQRDLQSALEPLGFAPERRPFRPHVTVGRARDRRGAPRALCAERPLDGAPFEATTLTLYQSTLAPGGAVYAPVERFPLSRDAT